MSIHNTPLCSLRIIKDVVDPSHLLHASSNRLRALILEELAYNEDDKECCSRLLKEGKVPLLSQIVTGKIPLLS